jgi:hypothetical protein
LAPFVLMAGFKPFRDFFGDERRLGIDEVWGKKWEKGKEIGVCRPVSRRLGRLR